MAIAKYAQVLSSTSVGSNGQMLELQMRDEPLGFVGGQYIIVDTGLTLPNGKICKRAYSIISADSNQERFSLAALRLPEGPGSAFMQALGAGDTLKFSGPWGKLRPQTPAQPAVGPSLILATDTGITAALGLAQAQAFMPWVDATLFVWLRTSSAYFLPEAAVRERLPARLRVLRMEALPPVGHVERVSYVRHVIGELRRRSGLTQAFLVGDGAVNCAISELLSQPDSDADMPAPHCLQENFFNAPKKS